MAIYPDKRGGKLTGRFRVELQRGKERYRARHDTLKEAERDEERVKALWSQGKDACPPEAAQEAPKGMSFSDGIAAADGILWRGSDNATCNFAHLRFFMKHIGEETPMDDISTAQVRQVLRELDKAEKSDATINRYLSHLRTFLGWQIREKNRTVPVEDINWDWRKETKGRLRWMTYEEEDTLLSLVPEKTARLIQVALATGCRREELLSARADQVEDDVFHIWKSKNNEARSVPLTRETSTMLRELIAGGMPSKRQLRRHWDMAKGKMGLAHDEEFVFHICRHTCATRMVDADVDILVIKEWLGHKRIETTQRYAKVRPKKLHSVLGRVGDLRSRETGKSHISAVEAAPHTSPTCGENEAFEQAA